MLLKQIKKVLDSIAWEEQVDFELDERYPEALPPDNNSENNLRKLASQMTPALLDALEHEEGYLIWVLRLSPYVLGENSRQRAQRFLNHQDGEVRYYANSIIEGVS